MPTKWLAVEVKVHENQDMSPEGAVLAADCFDGQDLKRIEELENEQRQFREWVMQSSDFSEDEKKAIHYNTLAEFKEYWGKAIETKSQLESCHEKERGLTSKRHRSFAAIVKRFMENFSPVIQIIRDFGAPYGNSAIGTISVLFVVASNKDKIEENLVATITGITDRLPGSRLYQHIYNDNHELDIRLQAKLVSAYESFIEFCITATRYSKIGGRLLRAIGGPGTLKTKSDEIQRLVVDVRHLCEELLDKNMDIIKRLNLEQAAKLKNLEAQIEQLQAVNDQSRLNEIQKLLKIETFSDDQPGYEIQSYRQTLDQSLDAEQFEQMRENRLKTFERSQNYRTWLESNQACLLILSGYNERSILDEDQCWLSPIALNHIEDLSHADSAAIVAYYLLPHQRQTLIHHVLPIILLQLLKRKRQALRDEKEYTELCTDLQKYTDSSDCSATSDTNEDARIATLQKIVLRVVNFFDESETVYLIVDRIDRCMYPGKADHRRALTKALVRMVEGARCKLKVLAVINGYDWRVEDIRYEFGAEKEGTLIIHTERQCRLDL